jgi:uncharacterized phage-associated protein
MSYPATVIANEVVVLALQRKISLTPLKLQKLVYFAHGWCLALTEKPLVSDSVEAWQYGPVIPSIYHEFKNCGNNQIEAPAGGEFRYIGGGKFVKTANTLEHYPDTEERQEAREIITKILETYGQFSGAKLSNATHMADSPWQQVYTEGSRHQVISNDLIKEYFKRLASA